MTAREQITSKDLTHEELGILNRSRILKTATFLLGAEGQGIGDPLDSMIFWNPDSRCVLSMMITICIPDQYLLVTARGR